MPNYAVIENNKVVNLCVAEVSDTKPNNWVLCGNGGIGWDYIDGQFVDNRAVSSAPEPTSPTKEQLLAQLQALQTQIQALE